MHLHEHDHACDYDPPKQTCTLLTKVPPEIRLKTYFFYTTTREDKTKIRPQVAAKEPALLATCQLIRAEALPVHYRHSKFIFEMRTSCRLVTSSLGTWLRQIGTERATMIESLFLCYAPDVERLNPSAANKDLAKLRSQERLASEQFLRAMMARGIRLESVKLAVVEGMLLFSANVDRAYWRDSMRYALAKIKAEEAAAEEARLKEEAAESTKTSDTLVQKGVELRGFSSSMHMKCALM